ncbi:MAG: hypothetical protein HZB41_09010 [Ignavibacteriae bacterium]|nr:hypothetical protein [Ignavibacteriota bacterium]
MDSLLAYLWYTDVKDSTDFHESVIISSISVISVLFYSINTNYYILAQT